MIRRVQSWLLSRGEAATTAAGISYLLAGKDAETVLDSARANFRCISGDQLRFEDMVGKRFFCKDRQNYFMAGYP